MRVSLINLLVIGGALIAAFVVTLIAVRIARWRRDVALRRHGAPVLVMPISNTDTPARPVNLSREVHPMRTSPTRVRRITPDSAPAIEPDVDVDDDDVILIADAPFTHRPTIPLRTVVDVEPEVDAAERGRMVQGAHLRYYHVEEGTLEFLPGRLEIVAGGEIGQEIHFLRQVGEDDATITFGRSEGPPLRHVQLLDPTVSRQHARLSFASGRWYLANLSQTNPVTLNGAALDPSGRAMTLAEGDRVEMGAVIFLFHER